MATFVLIPGAGGAAWYWHRLIPQLRERGHDAVAVDLPAGDAAAGLAQYADAVVASIGYRTGLVVVARSMGGFTAPLVCERLPVDLLVMLNAMVPKPGEAPGEWWEATRFAEARAEQAARDGRSLADDDRDLLDAFFHDVPPEVTAEAMAMGAPDQSGTPFVAPGRCPPGPMSRRASCRPATTASSPSRCSAASCASASASASRPTKCPAATSLGSAARASWPIAWRSTWSSCRPPRGRAATRSPAGG